MVWERNLKLIGTQIVTEFLQTILLTGRVKDESPVSTFIIAEPEHGKTTLCLESPTSSQVDLTDCTGRGLQEILKYKAEISHIILNDLTSIMGHGRTVRTYLFAMINAMTEEGIRTIAFPGSVETYQNGKRGIIACSTPALIKDARCWFNKTGLTSRILPFHYQYSESLVIKIKASITADQKNSKPQTLSIPEKPIHVNIPEREANEIQRISDSKSTELGDSTGIRRLKQFRKLAKAHSLIGANWTDAKVSQRELDFLMRIFPYVDYQKGCILL